MTKLPSVPAETTLGVCSDHAGFELKRQIISHLKALDYNVVDYGTDSSLSCDYPDFAHPCAQAVTNHECDAAIAMCGTGNGIAMTLNKHQEIRAALAWMPEIAALARQHNDANILVLPARFIEPETAAACVDTFLTAEFEGGRHQRRIDKIPV